MKTQGNALRAMRNVQFHDVRHHFHRITMGPHRTQVRTVWLNIGRCQLRNF